MTKDEIRNQLREIQHAMESLQEDLQKDLKNEGKYWTEEDVADAKALKQLFPDAVFVRRMYGDLDILSVDQYVIEDSWRSYIIPGLKEGETVRLNDIIGGRA